MRVPHVVILRIVEQVVDQRAAVVVVHRAVGEVEHLEAGQHRVAAARPVDDDLVALVFDARVDQLEVERDGVDAKPGIDPLLARQRVVAVVPGVPVSHAC